MHNLGRALMVGSLALVSYSVANAATITFNDLSGPNEAPFTSYQEAGFTVTGAVFQGAPEQGLLFGNPAPSLIIGAPLFAPLRGSVGVAATDGRRFVFSSMDLASNNGVSSDFNAEGFIIVQRGPILGPISLPVFSFTGLVPSGSPGDFVFVTETNPFTRGPIDALAIIVTPGLGVTSVNLDNIGVTVVPEPSTIVLIGLTLGAGALARWRRRRQQ